MSPLVALKPPMEWSPHCSAAHRLWQFPTSVSVSAFGYKETPPKPSTSPAASYFLPLRGMTIIVSDSPSDWPTIWSNRVQSYAQTAMTVLIIYSWALDIGDEIELIWKRRDIRIILLYVVLRYLSILASIIWMLELVPFTHSDNVCRTIFSLDNVTSFIIVVTLSSMMVLRVHALCGQPRNLLRFLLGFLAIYQAVAVASRAVEYNKSNGSQVGGALLSGTSMCFYMPSTAYPWVNSLTNGLSLAFETTLFSCSMYQFVRHVKESGLRPLAKMTNFFSILIRDQVLYYLLALTADVFTTLNILPELQQANLTGTIWNCVVIVQQSWIMAMMGPALMVGLLRSEARMRKRDTLTDHELGTMVFAVGPGEVRYLTIDLAEEDAEDRMNVPESVA